MTTVTEEELSRRLLSAAALVRLSACFLLGPLLWASPLLAQTPQNPSPMVEHTRAHDRIRPVQHDGTRVELDAGLPAPVSLFIPPTARASTGDSGDLGLALLIHLMGADYIAEDAVVENGFHDVLAVLNLGSGSRAFERPFQKADAFDRLLDSLTAATSRLIERPVTFEHIDLSAFSAGYGGVRGILSRHAERIHGVLLLDALHTGYVPEHTPLSEGGRLDTTLLEPFAAFAEAAVAGEKALVLTHSEVFPGTFASTTETSDYLLDVLGLTREAVLEWGPVGMQQLSVAARGGFRVLGFAGNSAPDHVDHLHGVAGFLCLLHAPHQKCRFSEPAID